MALPQTNARLVSVATDGPSEDWDQPAGGAGPFVWQGNEDAYVVEAVRTNYLTGSGEMTKTRDIRIIVSDELIEQFSFETGQIMTYQYKGITHTRRIMEYDSPFLPSLPSYLRYTIYHLNPEPLETSTEQQ